MSMRAAIADTPDRIELEIGFAEEAIAISNAFVQGDASTPERLISALFLARAAQALRSCCILTPYGALGDAMSVARTIVELDIEHAYIMQADTESRWQRYVAFDAVSVHKLLSGAAALHESTIPQEMLDLWHERARAAKQLAGDERHWAGKGMDIRKRALATGRDHQYDIAFRNMCGASHGGFSTFAYVTDLAAPRIPVEIYVGFGPPSAQAIAICMPSMVDLLRIATDPRGGCDEFAHLRARADDLDARMRAAYEERDRGDAQ